MSLAPLQGVRQQSRFAFAQQEDVQANWKSQQEDTHSAWETQQQNTQGQGAGTFFQSLFPGAHVNVADADRPLAVPPGFPGPQQVTLGDNPIDPGLTLLRQLQSSSSPSSNAQNSTAREHHGVGQSSGQVDSDIAPLYTGGRPKPPPGFGLP